MAASNTIHKLTFDVASTDRRTDGHALSDWIREALLPVIENVVKGGQPGLKSRRIEKIEIDLGTVYQHEAPSELARRLHAKLSAALEFDVSPHDAASQNRELGEAHFNQLIFFLRTGQIEWEYATHPSVAHTQLLQKAIDGRTSGGLEKLRSLVTDTQALSRMVKQFQTAQLFQLVRRFLEAWPDETSSAIMHWLSMELVNTNNAPSAMSLSSYVEKLWTWVLPLAAEYPITFTRFSQRCTELTGETFTQNLARHQRAVHKGDGMSEPMRAALMEQVIAMQKGDLALSDTVVHKQPTPDKTRAEILPATNQDPIQNAEQESATSQDRNHRGKSRAWLQDGAKSPTAIKANAPDWISITEALIAADDEVLEDHWIVLFDTRPDLIKQTQAQAWKRWIEKLPFEKCVDLAALLQPDVFYLLQTWGNLRPQLLGDKGDKGNNFQPRSAAESDITQQQVFIAQALPQLLAATPGQLTVRDFLQQQSYFAEQLRAQIADEVNEAGSPLASLAHALSTLLHELKPPVTQTDSTVLQQAVLRALIATDVIFLERHWSTIVSNHANAVREAYPQARVQWLKRLSLTQLYELAPLIQASATDLIARLLEQVPQALHQSFLRTSLAHLFLAPLDSLDSAQLLPVLRPWINKNLPVAKASTGVNAVPPYEQSTIEIGQTTEASDKDEREQLYRALLDLDHALLTPAWARLLKNFPELIARARPFAWQGWVQELSDSQLHDIAQALQVHAYTALRALTANFTPSKKQKLFEIALPHLLAAPTDTVEITHLFADENALRAALNEEASIRETLPQATALAELSQVNQGDSLVLHAGRTRSTTAMKEAHEAFLLRALIEADNQTLERHWQQILLDYGHLIVAAQAQAWPKWIAVLSEEKCLALARFLQAPALDFLLELSSINEKTFGANLSQTQLKTLLPRLLSSHPKSISPSTLLAEFPSLIEQFSLGKEVIDRHTNVIEKNAAVLVEALISADNATLDAHWHEIIHVQPQLILATQDRAWSTWLKTLPQKKLRDIATVLQPQIARVLEDIASAIDATVSDHSTEQNKRQEIIRQLFATTLPVLLRSAAHSVSAQSLLKHLPDLGSQLSAIAALSPTLAKVVAEHFSITQTLVPARGSAIRNTEEFARLLNTILQEEKFEALQTWWPQILLSRREDFRQVWKLLSTEKKTRLHSVFSPSQQLDLATVLQPHIAHFLHDYHHQLGKLISQAQLVAQQSTPDAKSAAREKVETATQLIKALEQTRDAALACAHLSDAPRLAISTVLQSSLGTTIKEFPQILDGLNAAEMAQHSRHVRAFIEAQSTPQRQMTEIDPDLHLFRLWQQGELTIADQDLSVLQLRRWLNWWMLHSVVSEQSQEEQGKPYQTMLEAIVEKSESSGQVARFLELVLEALRLGTEIDFELITQQIASEESNPREHDTDTNFAFHADSPFLFADSLVTESPTAQEQVRRIEELESLLESIREGDLDLATLNSAELIHLLQTPEFSRSDKRDSTNSEMPAASVDLPLETIAFASTRPSDALRKMLDVRLHHKTISIEKLEEDINDADVEQLSPIEKTHTTRSEQAEARNTAFTKALLAAIDMHYQPAADAAVDSKFKPVALTQTDVIISARQKQCQLFAFAWLAAQRPELTLEQLQSMFSRCTQRPADVLGAEDLEADIKHGQAAQQLAAFVSSLKLETETQNQFLHLLDSIFTTSNEDQATRLTTITVEPQLQPQPVGHKQLVSPLPPHILETLGYRISNAILRRDLASLDLIWPEILGYHGDALLQGLRHYLSKPQALQEFLEKLSLQRQREIVRAVSAKSAVLLDELLVGYEHRPQAFGQGLSKEEWQSQVVATSLGYLLEPAVESDANDPAQADTPHHEALRVNEDTLLETLLSSTAKGNQEHIRTIANAWHDALPAKKTPQLQQTLRQFLFGKPYQEKLMENAAVRESSLASSATWQSLYLEELQAEYPHLLDELFAKISHKAFDLRVLSTEALRQLSHHRLAQHSGEEQTAFWREFIANVRTKNLSLWTKGNSPVDTDAGSLVPMNVENDLLELSRPQYEAALRFLLSQPRVRGFVSSVSSTTTVMPGLIRHPEFDLKAANTGFRIKSGMTGGGVTLALESADLNGAVNANAASAEFKQSHTIDALHATTTNTHTTVMPDLIRHPEFNFRPVNTGFRIKSGMTGGGATLTLENTDINGAGNARATYAEHKQSHAIDAMRATTTNTLTTVMPDLIQHPEFNFKPANTGFRIKSGMAAGGVLSALEKTKANDVEHVRAKKFEPHSTLRDEERLCLLLQTKSHISALDTEMMELLLQRLLSATTTSTHHRSLISALQSRLVLERLFSHIPLSTIQRLLRQLAPAQAETLPAFAEQILRALRLGSAHSSRVAWQAIFDVLFAQGLLIKGERDRVAYLRAFVHALKLQAKIEDEAQSVKMVLNYFERADSPSTKKVENTGTLTTAKVAKKIVEETPMPPAIVGEAYVHNAGMVLVAPYLQRLWGILELTANGSFIDETAAQRAVHLLQYIVTGKNETPEYQLVLNKLLCGIHGGVPIALGIVITEKEKEIIAQMLQGIIANWSALGTTSVQGLRETFLQRQAYLDYREDAWHMKVQTSAFDMLLDRLPWSFALIRFPWMTAPLHVTWR